MSPPFDSDKDSSSSVVEHNALLTAFELASGLISCPDYHAMTHTLLAKLQSFPGVEEVISYEVLEKSATNTTGLENNCNMFFRRFPLRFDNIGEDENKDILLTLLSRAQSPISFHRYDDKPYIILDITKNVYPRRAILIQGRLDQHHLVLLQGLHDIYATQTALLDNKERDVLTHLLNRQSLDHILLQIMNFCRDAGVKPENHQASWVALLDIDHFKKINDNYGHLFGDEVLIHFANIMKNQFRYSDFTFRYGGEEFLVILNQTNQEGAELTLNRFREAVEAHKFPSGKVTVSIGYTFLDFDSTISSVLEQADKAVYSAKENGRNKTVYFGSIKSTDNEDKGDDIELF